MKNVEKRKQSVIDRWQFSSKREPISLSERRYNAWWQKCTSGKFMSSKGSTPRLI